MAIKSKASKTLTALLVIFLGNCKIGWKNLERGKYAKQTNELLYNELSDSAKLCLCNAVESEKRFDAIVIDDSSSQLVDRQLIVSADFNGWPLRKMGYYFKYKDKKYFLEHNKASPRFICDDTLYYTFEYAILHCYLHNSNPSFYSIPLKD